MTSSEVLVLPAKVRSFFYIKQQTTMEGWICLYRQFMQWQWWTKPEMVQLFIYLLLRANVSTRKDGLQQVKRGELLTSIATISEETGLSIRQVRTGLDRLQKTGEITMSATNKNTLVTICNYDSYQDRKNKNDKQATSKTTSKTTSKRQAPTISDTDNYGASFHIERQAKRQAKRQTKQAPIYINNNNKNNITIKSGGIEKAEQEINHHGHHLTEEEIINLFNSYPNVQKTPVTPAAIKAAEKMKGLSPEALQTTFQRINDKDTLRDRYFTWIGNEIEVLSTEALIEAEEKQAAAIKKREQEEEKAKRAKAAAEEEQQRRREAQIVAGIKKIIGTDYWDLRGKDGRPEELDYIAINIYKKYPKKASVEQIRDTYKAIITQNMQN